MPYEESAPSWDGHIELYSGTADKTVSSVSLKGLVAGAYTFELTHTTTKTKPLLEILMVRIIGSTRQAFIEAAGSRVEISLITHYKPPVFVASTGTKYPWKNVKVALKISPETFATLHITALKDDSNGTFISKTICPPGLGSNNRRWDIDLENKAQLIFSGKGHQKLEVISTDYAITAIYGIPNI